MQVQEIQGRLVKLWADEVDPLAQEQLRHLCSLPFLYHHLAVMPDVHAGMGVPIGTVLACQDVLIPNAVGVDIGCGMCAVRTSWHVSELPRELLRDTILPRIQELIPMGLRHHTEAQDVAYLPTGHDIDSLPVVKQRQEAIRNDVGTLGGGNHFIELQQDEAGMLWVMLHSGSRNLGARIATHYNEIAERLNRRWYAAVDPSLRLAFLPQGTREFGLYWQEMKYGIDFALANRRLMMLRIQDALSESLRGIDFDPMINIAHNYASREEHFGQQVFVHRKGATRADAGLTGIIPGSQGSASYIVEGLGNAESFRSCSHGAGRRLSRKAAIRGLDLEAEVAHLEAQGILHAVKRRDDLQEATGAYKDIEEVMTQQQDLVRIQTRLRPLAVLKG